MWGRGGGRNLYKPVLRARAAVTRRGATERGTSGVEHPRSGVDCRPRERYAQTEVAAPGRARMLRVLVTSCRCALRVVRWLAQLANRDGSRLAFTPGG